MNETELERMVVRLIGDSEQYRKMLEDAAKKTDETAQKLEAHAGKIEKFEEGLKKYAGAAAELFMAHKATDFLKDSLGEWEIAENTAIKLSAALEANGREVEDQLSAYQEWAAEQQKVTTIGDDTNLMLLKQAETFDLTGEKAQQAAEQAQALAAINDSSAEAMMRMTAAMTKGDTDTAMMFARMIPQLRGVKNEMEFVEKYNKLVASGQKVLTEEAKTFGGQMKQLNNDLGDFKEEIGQITAQILVPFVKMLKEVVHWFQGLDKGWKIAIVTATMLSAGILSVSAAITVLLPLLKILSTAGIFSTAATMGVFALAAAVTGGLVYAVVEGTRQVSGLSRAMEELRQQSARGIELDVKIRDANQGRFDKELKGFLSIENLPERRAAMQEVLDRELVTLQTHHRQMTEAIDEYNKSLRDNDTLYGSDGSVENAKKNADYHTGFYGETVKRVEALKKAMRETEETRSAVAKEALKDMQKEYDMIGMTNGQKKIRELIDKGVAERMLAEVKAQAALNDERQRGFEIEQAYGEMRGQEKQAVQDFIRTLETEIETMGWSSEEKKYAALQTAYLTDEERTYARELIRGLEITRDRQKMMETIKETTKQFQTPLEEFTARQKELDEQLKNGLGIDTYNRALDSARKKFDDATGASNAFRDSVIKVNSVLSGSGAAREAVDEYLNRIRPQDRRAQPAAGVNALNPVPSGGLIPGGLATFNAQAGDPSSNPVLRLLQNIDRSTSKTAGTPSINLKPANAS